MAYISKYVDLDGSQYDIKSKKTAAIPYAQVDSTSTSTKFTATVPEITELYDGVCVYLRNQIVTSAANFTININGLGAKPVYSSLAESSRSTTIFNVNYTMLFIYNSTRVTDGCWDCFYGYDSNTNTIGYQLRTQSSSRPMDSITYRYRLLFSSVDNKKWVPANNSTSTNATAVRTVNQTKINPFGEIAYYGTTSSVAAGSQPSTSYLWQQYGFALGYSFNNTGVALDLTYPAPVYIKCAPQTDGSAIIDSTNPYVQELPSTEDGAIYIYLGRAYSDTSVEMVLDHPVYYYKDGQIRIYTNAAASGPTITVDSALSSTSENPVQNKVIYSALEGKADSSNIPTKTSDLTNDSGYITDAGVTSFNGSTGAVTYTAPVTSVNGNTGAVTLSASDVGALPNNTTLVGSVSVTQNLTSGTKVGTITVDNSSTDLYAPTNTDTKLTQTYADSSNYYYWRPLIVGYSSGESESFTPSTVTNTAYTFKNIKCQPSTGTIKASTFKGALDGVASGNLKSGDNISSLTNDSGYITDAGVTSVNGSTGAVTGIQTTGNLVTSVSSSSTDSQYPSAKLFYDTLGDVESLLAAI